MLGQSLPTNIVFVNAPKTTVFLWFTFLSHCTTAKIVAVLSTTFSFHPVVQYYLLVLLLAFRVSAGLSLSSEVGIWFYNVFQIVAVHCLIGRGRTGSMIACYFIHTRGMSSTEAINYTRQIRPGSIETPEQEQLIHDFEKHIADNNTGLNVWQKQCDIQYVHVVCLSLYMHRR